MNYEVIKLTKGQSALIDSEDIQLISQYKWCFNTGYAVTTTYNSERPKRIYMHRLVVNAPNGMFVDHHDHNTLNNRKSNLRLCTNAENQRNSKKHINCTSRFKGVFVVSANKGRNFYYRMIIKINGHVIGKSFPFSPEGEVLAAIEYNRVAKEHYGDFAYLNHV
jgi:hypothetical protein